MQLSHNFTSSLLSHHYFFTVRTSIVARHHGLESCNLPVNLSIVGEHSGIGALPLHFSKWSHLMML